MKPRGEDIITTAEEVLGAVVKERRAKPKPRPYIFIDTREQRPLRFAPGLGVDCGVAKLDVGDYSVRGFSHLFVAERKSLADLVQSLSHERERFEDELRIMQQYPWPIIVVEARQDEAEIGAYRSLMVPRAVIGSLDAIWMKYAIPTRWCGNPAGAAEYIAWVARRLHAKHADQRVEPEKESA